MWAYHAPARPIPAWAQCFSARQEETAGGDQWSHTVGLVSRVSGTRLVFIPSTACQDQVRPSTQTQQQTLIYPSYVTNYPPPGIFQETSRKWTKYHQKRQFFPSKRQFSPKCLILLCLALTSHLWCSGPRFPAGRGKCCPQQFPLSAGPRRAPLQAFPHSVLESDLAQQSPQPAAQGDQQHSQSGDPDQSRAGW